MGKKSRGEKSKLRLAPGEKIALRDRLVAPLFLTAFGVTLWIFDLIQRLAFMISLECQQKVVNTLNRCLVGLLHLSGISTEVQSRISTTIPNSGYADIGEPGTPIYVASDIPCLVVSNHQSLYDIPLIHVTFAKRYPRFIAKKELGAWVPSVSFNLRNGGSALVNRKDPVSALLTIKEFATRMLRNNYLAVMFPEGTRARDGNMRPFRTVGLQKLLEIIPELCVVPVTMDGSHNLFRLPFLPLKLGSKVKMIVHDPVVVKRGDNLPVFLQGVEDTIRHALGK